MKLKKIIDIIFVEILNFSEGFKLLFIKQMNLLLRSFHLYDLYTEIPLLLSVIRILKIY